MVRLKIPHPGHFSALKEIIGVKEADGELSSVNQPRTPLFAPDGTV